MYTPVPVKTDIIDSYYNKTLQLVASHLSTKCKNAFDFSLRINKILKSRGMSNTKSDMISSLFVLKYNLSDVCRFTTTKNRVNQLYVISLREGFIFNSYNSEYSRKTSVVIQTDNG